MRDLIEIYVPLSGEVLKEETFHYLCSPPTFTEWLFGKGRHITVSLKIKGKMEKKDENS